MNAKLTSRGNYIDGAWRIPANPDGAIHRVSPADTNDVLDDHLFARSAVDDAVSAARNAARLWRKTTWEARCEHLHRYRAELDAHTDAFIDTLIREVGKPQWDARSELKAMIGKIDISISAGLAWAKDEEILAAPGSIRFQPLGVVAVIGPFNFPGHLPNGQFVPALLHGNTVVFKPSEKAPNTASVIAECMQRAGLPPGVFNMVQGDATVAEALSAHENIDGILFTGSVAVGQKIAASNVHRTGRLIALELGGKNASIALEDCDMDTAAREIAFAGYASSGQRCSSTSRVIVVKDRADELISRLVSIAEGIHIGYPRDADVFMGPVISNAARDRFINALTKAQTNGFSAASSFGAFSVHDHPGYYVRPSVHVAKKTIVDVPGYTDNELFGPDLAVYIVSGDDEAIALTNRSNFGLSASVFTKEKARFDAIADELEVGVVHWNRSTAGASSHLPFGGPKLSGNHRPGARWMGHSCGYPQARLLPNANPALMATSWPGFPKT